MRRGAIDVPAAEPSSAAARLTARERSAVILPSDLYVIVNASEGELAHADARMRGPPTCTSRAVERDAGPLPTGA